VAIESGVAASRSPHALRAGAHSGHFSAWRLSRLPRSQAIGRITFLLMMVAALIISAITTINAVKWVGLPFAGFLVNERMVFGNLGRYDWPGTQAGLKWPDKVVKADGEPISSMRDLSRVIEQVPVGAAIKYQIDRKGQLVDVSVPTMQFTWLDWFMTFGITFFSGLVYILIGVIVFILKPDTSASWAFLLSCWSLGLFSITSFDVQSTHFGFIRLYFACNALFPAALVHLGLVFPERRKLFEDRPYLYAAPYVLAALLIVPLEILYPRPAFLPFQDLVRFYAILAAFAVVASTLHSFLANRSILARQRAKVVLAGAALGFPIPALGLFLSLAGSALTKIPIQNNFLAVPIIFFPASIAYAIARHNLFDVDVYIKRAVGYAIMTMVVGTAYASMQTALTGILGPIFGEARDTVYPIFFALLVVLFFNPINRRVQDAVDRIFFRKGFDYKKTVSAVSNALTSMLNLDQIIFRVIYAVRTEMFVDTAGVVVVDAMSGACRTFFIGEDAQSPSGEPLSPAVGYDDPLLQLVREEKMVVTRYEIEEDPRFADVRQRCLLQFEELGATVAIPLVYHERVTGVLAVGRKKSGHFYSREDIDLLTTMADQAAVAIQNANTHEEVVRYAEELAASLRRIQLLESIKTNLAKFVPKTVQEAIEESPEAPSLEKRDIDVSVLFADITGYTRLSAKLEMEHVNRLVERYFSAFLDEIMSRGGDVNETAGDGLMVIFRKKDPKRHARAAVLTALGIQQRTREINAELEGQYEPIVMKVGVNSGIASVGATRIEGASGTRWTYTASGPTTNVAARLAALAEGAEGGVVVSEETQSRLTDPFAMEDMGPQALKNVPHPVRAFRIMGREAPAPQRPDPRELGRDALRLYVVSREHPDVYADLKRQFEGSADVDVILDRRQGERQQRSKLEIVERRQEEPAGQVDGTPEAEARSEAGSPASPKA
jgi:class 3 adenylate cyclase